MGPPRLGTIALCLLTLLSAIPVPTTAKGTSAIDTTAFVTRVIDGDTIESHRLDRVRLADINAPEVGRPGAAEATAYLVHLVHRLWVHLDVDDLYGTDRFGRHVAVAYVRHNATHLLNVNLALLDAGHARLRDFPNEFDPAAWSRFMYYPMEEDPLVEDGPGDVVLGVVVLIASFIAGCIVFPLFRFLKATSPKQ